VWRKESGTWRVVLDFGMRVPQPTRHHELGLAFVPLAPQATTGRPLAEQELRSLDAKLLERTRSGAGSDRAVFDDDIVVLRPRQAPAIGPEAAQQRIAEPAPLMTTSFRGGASSRAGDLAYTWGEAITNSGAGEPQQGWYARVWRRHGNEWKLLVDARRENPPAPPAQ
jgi:ketosteroid isomerase-like protein